MLVWRSYVIVDILQRLPVFWSKRKKSHGYKFSVACLATEAYSHIKNFFTGVCLFTPGGYPSPRFPSQVTGPRSFPVGCPSSRFFLRSPLGVPQSWPGGTRWYPWPGQDGVHPPAWSGWGTPPQPGTPPPPGTEQQSAQLLRRGRYVSCVHAGGLSCLRSNASKHLHKTLQNCHQYLADCQN